MTFERDIPSSDAIDLPQAPSIQLDELDEEILILGERAHDGYIGVQDAICKDIEAGEEEISRGIAKLRGRLESTVKKVTGTQQTTAEDELRIRDATLMASIGVCMMLAALIIKSTEGVLLLIAIILLTAITVSAVLAIITQKRFTKATAAQQQAEDEGKVGAAEIADLADMGVDEAMHLLTISEGLKTYASDTTYRFDLVREDVLYEEKRELNALFDMADQQANTRRALVQNIAHEIKTPLASLRLIAEGIEDGVFSSDDDYTRSTINENVERIDSTVKMMTDFVKGYGDEMEEISGDVIESLLGAKAKATAMARRREEVEVTCHISPSLDGLVSAGVPIMAKMSSDAMYAILDAIVENAFEHARNMTHLSLAAECTPTGEILEGAVGKGQVFMIAHGDMVCVSVADDGEGMTEDMAHKMLLPFWKADESHTLDAEEKGKAASPGLGLSIAKNMIESNGGRFSVECSQDSGTKVSMWMPCVGSDKVIAQMAQSASAGDDEASSESGRVGKAVAVSVSSSQDDVWEAEGIDDDLRGVLEACGARVDGDDILIG